MRNSCLVYCNQFKLILQEIQVIRNDFKDEAIKIRNDKFEKIKKTILDRGVASKIVLRKEFRKNLIFQLSLAKCKNYCPGIT